MRDIRELLKETKLWAIINATHAQRDPSPWDGHEQGNLPTRPSTRELQSPWFMQFVRLACQRELLSPSMWALILDWRHHYEITRMHGIRYGLIFTWRGVHTWLAQSPHMVGVNPHTWHTSQPFTMKQFICNGNISYGLKHKKYMPWFKLCNG